MNKKMSSKTNVRWGGGYFTQSNVKAFTLIELLAVIVILAIIALIATPIILGVINDSKEKAFRLSLKNVEHAYSLYVAKHQADENFDTSKLIDIKDLPLDIKNITGKVTTNKDGKIELKQVTDGTYSAEGTLNNLTVIKGPVDKLVEHKLDVKININFLSKSIVVTVDLVGEGIPKKYKYIIEGPEDYTETIIKEVGKDEIPESHTFDNLTIGEEYTVKVYVTNSTGKTTKESTKTEKTIDPQPEIDLQATGKTYTTTDKTYMTSGKITITYPSNEYKNYYRWDDWEDERFEEYTGEIEAQNGMITAIVKDGEETISSSTQTITTIDIEGPTITKIEKSGLTVTIQATDTLSGVKEYSCNGGTTWKTSNICEFTEEGTYIVKARDNLLNEITENITVQSFDENNGSQPALGTLTPVVYDEENSAWVVVSSADSSWSDYANQKWGNAVLLKENITKEVGDTVTVEGSSSEREVVAMFVWIPRYEYKIEGQYGTHPDGTAGTKDLPGEIEVNFISKDIVYEGINSEGYRIHPAFWWDDNSNGERETGEELDGIWVGKFETTGSDPTILPNLYPLDGEKVSEQFAIAQKFEITGYDSHMAKNSEWGAAAYLSQSKYGKYGNSNYEGSNKKVANNNYYSNSSYKTGGNDYKNNIAQSTTGNITGIYDMSGGTDEYVMGVFNKNLGSSGFTTSTLPEAKYYDNYTSTTGTTACNGGICYGHALSETSGWYSGVENYGTWLCRGGHRGIAYISIFSFNPARGGDAWSYISFRIVLSQTT